MPRIDDYKQALDLGKEALSGRNPDILASFSGSVIHRDRERKVSFSLNFLNKETIISWPDLEFSYNNSHEELPIQKQILLLHYLSGAWSSSGATLTGEWIAFQDVPDGKFYLEAFRKRAKDPFVKALGPDPGLLIEIAREAYDADPFDYGDFAVLVKALPRVPVALILWKGDEEFPPEGNVLFDRSISDIFSAEDIAWLAGMVVYPLIGMVGK
jgi:hypothetical protein